MLFVSLLILGLWAGCIYALIAIGLVLVKQTGGFVNFSHGASIILGTYSAYACMIFMINHTIIGLIAGILVASTSALFFEFAVFKTLRKRDAPSFVLMIASLALFIITANIISIIFGDRTLVLPIEHSQGVTIFGTKLTLFQISTMAVTVLLLLGLVALFHTNIGLKIRAIADDRELSMTFGINTDAVIIWATMLSSITATLGGFLWAAENDITPMMGLRLLLYGLVAAIVGEHRGIKGVILCGLLIGLIQNLGIWKLPSRWQDSIVLIILLIFYVLRLRKSLGGVLKEIQV